MRISYDVSEWECSVVNSIKIIQIMGKYVTDHVIRTSLHFMDSIVAVNEYMSVLTATLLTVLKMYEIAFSDLTSRNTECESYS
jgi:hypothetical protein